ncbi:MAG: class I adenylate-forming enzyme family protein [Olegusella sp.]|nr:class I adenylate-forming enzyme family protein [Olegusella sp.]
MDEAKGLTGCPSVDKPWLQYYKEGAEREAKRIPEGKTVWDVVEDRLHQHSEIPAIEYFGNRISRQKLIDMVYEWARAFRALGVEEGEIVPYFGPFFPDVGAMALALNAIGACPYFLKLAIIPEALAEETREARLAIVFDEMWERVSCEFSKERFRNVILVTASDAMPSPMRQALSIRSLFRRRRGLPKTTTKGKYLSVAQSKRFAKRFQGEVKARFVKGREAFITSSSGTTVNGVVKGVVATNESVISQLLMADATGVQYHVGDRCLNNLPPTASTSLNMLFMVPLCSGSTVVVDPRVSTEDFFEQITRLKPHAVLTTSSVWEAFFRRVSREIEAGAHFDFSFATSWVIGGEGPDVAKYREWTETLGACGGTRLAIGYGTSELFSSICAEEVNARCSRSKPVPSVGIPFAGMTVGVFDDAGNELGYEQRGELWVKSGSAMKEYYGKPELTMRTKVDGWIRTGDLAEIDEDGYVYIWGRMGDAIPTRTPVEGCDGGLYLFDIALRIKRHPWISDAIVLPASTRDGITYLSAHVAWKTEPDVNGRKSTLVELDTDLQAWLPDDVKVWAWAEHGKELPYDPNTLKRDRNRLASQREGFLRVEGDKVVPAELTWT